MKIRQTEYSLDEYIHSMNFTRRSGSLNRGIVAGIMELSGAVLLVGGLFMVSWPLAVATLGGLVILTALVIQKGGN
jgi:hypothetical protein